MHLQTAIYQSILATTQNALKTKTVHSEILWSLNASNNVWNEQTFADMDPVFCAGDMDLMLSLRSPRLCGDSALGTIPMHSLSFELVHRQIPRISSRR